MPRKQRGGDVSSLIDAVYHGDVDKIGQVLDTNASNIDSVLEGTGTPLGTACRNELWDIAKLFVEKGADVNKADETGETALMITCEVGNYDFAKYLIERGANYVTDDSETKTSMLSFACMGGSIQIVRLLLEKNLEVNTKNVKGFSPLFFACVHQSYDIANLLLAKGADVNVQDKDGFTILMAAVYRDVQLVQFLLENGADAKLKNNKGETALQIAMKNREKIPETIFDLLGDSTFYDDSLSIYKWALNSDDSDVFPSVCETLLTDVDGKFYDFKQKVSYVCSNIVQKPITTKSRLRAVKKDEITIEEVDPDSPLDSLIFVMRKIKATTLPFELENFTVSYKNQEGVGPGVVRDFISGCIEQASKELLAPIAAGSDLYHIKFDRRTDAKTKDKLRAFGYLLAIMLYNGLSFPFKLKRSLLHMCLYNTEPSRDVSYVVYELMENPEWAAGVIALLKKPSDIEHVGLDFEDVQKSPKSVTSRNYVSFLRTYVEFTYIPKYCTYVADGFYMKTLAAEELVAMGMSVYDMYEKLCNQKIDKESIKNFVTTQVVYGESVSIDVKTWFTNMVTSSDPDFFRNLLHFWSGFYVPIQGTKYQVVIGSKVITQKVCPLAESHTCYTQLVLPDGIPNEEKLREILEKAVGYVAKGVTMYGGKRPKRIAPRAKKSHKIFVKYGRKKLKRAERYLKHSRSKNLKDT